METGLARGVAIGGGVVTALAAFALYGKPSPHFDWSEFDADEAPFGARLNLFALIWWGLEGTRAECGGHALIPTSGFRTAQKQDALIAAGMTTTKDSDHEVGKACDFVIPDFGSPSVVMGVVYANRARHPWKQVILEYLNGVETHVHVAIDTAHLLDPANARQEFLYTLDRKNYLPWTPTVFV